jgi:DNA-binding transcriptional MocR family regulator
VTLIEYQMYKPLTRSWPTKIYKHIIYAVPSFSNPTGRCMTLQCREDLVLLAREFDALIITDDVYDFLWWPVDESTDEQPENGRASSPFRAVLPRLVDIDRALPGTTPFGNAISNGSFSKICAPGVRTGWVESPSTLSISPKRDPQKLTIAAATPALATAVSQAGSSRSGGAASGVAASLLGAALAAGTLQRHVTSVLRPSYARRWRAMRDAVREHLAPLGASLPFPHVDVRALHVGGGGGGPGAPAAALSELPAAVAGGYFLYVRLPRDISANALAARAEERAGVIVQTEGMCLVPKVAGTSGEVRVARGGEGDQHIRLCFAWEDEEVLVEGVRRLSGVLKDMLSGDNETLYDTSDRSGSRYS